MLIHTSPNAQKTMHTYHAAVQIGVYLVVLPRVYYNDWSIPGRSTKSLLQ